MKKVLIGLTLIGVVACVVFYKLYNKPHRNPVSEKSIPISSASLFNSFENKETEANLRYLDKVLEISGKIVKITANQNQMPVIVLETDNSFFGVRCTMADNTIEVQEGETIVVKGICTGYLSDVIITNSIIVKGKTDTYE